MNSISSLWHRLAATRYTRTLEAEVTRLRAENRALLNSILGIAGVPPITLPDSATIENISGKCSSGPSRAVGEASAKTPALPGRGSGKMQGASAVPTIRKRSWHQIYRMLEFDSARKKPGAIDGTTMPRTS